MINYRLIYARNVVFRSSHKVPIQSNESRHEGNIYAVWMQCMTGRQSAVAIDQTA